MLFVIEFVGVAQKTIPGTITQSSSLEIAVSYWNRWLEILNSCSKQQSSSIGSAAIIYLMVGCLVLMQDLIAASNLDKAMNAYFDLNHSTQVDEEEYT